MLVFRFFELEWNASLLKRSFGISDHAAEVYFLAKVQWFLFPWRTNLLTLSMTY